MLWEKVWRIFAMNQEQKEQLRKQLFSEEAEITSRLEQTEGYGLELSMKDSVGELSSYDNHPADLGSEVFERGKDLALQDADQHHLEEVKQAIALIGTEKYGVCEICHQEIPFERMEALPWTTTCKEHHPDPHVSDRRPIEEEALGSYTHSFKDNSDYNGFDGEDAWQAVERYGTSNPPDFFPDGEGYNQLFINSDEQRGYIDLTEGFAITDITGNSEGFPEIVHNDAYRKKEQEFYNEESEG